MASRILTLLTGAALLAAAAPVGAQLVRVESGTLQGATTGGVTTFRGIPFAAPPVGPLRWRAPQPAVRWSGVRAARDYGADCMQRPFPEDAAPLATVPAEDCLYANVWRPAGPARGLPVLVWIHGGAFLNGGASPPTYDGAALARQGVVVVSFNYRLGRFGTFALPQLTAADPDHGRLANYGVMDQLAALGWVRRNIAGFGGDPQAVTIMGESAGGMAVHTLMTAPDALGLFRGAVILSGGTASSEGRTLATAEAAGIAFARHKGIAADDPAALAKLRALSAEAVVDGFNLMSRDPEAEARYSGPVADGRLAVDAAAAYAAGRFARVPVMVGATSDDIGGADGAMIAGADAVAGQLSRAGVPVFLYRFDYVAGSVRRADTQGAAHASDIPFFLDTAGIKYGAQTTATDRAAARLASGYLVAFVKTGDPNGGGRPAWRTFRDGAPMLTLGADGGAQ